MNTDQFLVGSGKKDTKPMCKEFTIPNTKFQRNWFNFEVVEVQEHSDKSRIDSLLTYQIFLHIFAEIHP